MPTRIPFIQSKNNYRLVVPMENTEFLLDVRWNALDEAWYFDLREEDETLILAGIKIVLGIPLGRTSTHIFFQTHLLTVIDSSGTDVDAAYDDLGARIQVSLTSSTEVTA